MQEGRKPGRFVAGQLFPGFLLSCLPKIEPGMLASVHAAALALPDRRNKSFGSGRRPGWVAVVPDLRFFACRDQNRPRRKRGKASLEVVLGETARRSSILAGPSLALSRFGLVYRPQISI